MEVQNINQEKTNHTYGRILAQRQDIKERVSENS